MIKQVDVKWQINDELEAILFLIRRLEGDVKSNVPTRKEKRKLMKALKSAERGVETARSQLG